MFEAVTNYNEMNPLQKQEIKKRQPRKDIEPHPVQYDLFSSFFGDKNQDWSNTIEFWDAIPKYSFTARQQVSLRNQDGTITTQKVEFKYRDSWFVMELQPASIEVDGKFKSFLPSADEELIEEVLRKFFTDKNHALHDVEREESWVRWTIGAIRDELAKRNKTRSNQQIANSLRIMNLCNVTVYRQGGSSKKPMYSNPILSDYVASSEKEMGQAKFPVLVSHVINQVKYRQFNYGTWMRLEDTLTRQIHKQLCHFYVNASKIYPRSMLLSDVRSETQLLHDKNISKATDQLEKALDCLASESVLTRWEKEEKRGARNKLLDVHYLLHPTDAFIKETKASNERQKVNKVQLERETERKTDRRLVVDKSKF